MIAPDDRDDITRFLLLVTSRVCTLFWQNLGMGNAQPNSDSDRHGSFVSKVAHRLEVFPENIPLSREREMLRIIQWMGHPYQSRVGLSLLTQR